MNENKINRNRPDLKQVALDYGRMVSSICTRMIFNPHIAEEAAQETWLEITRSLKVSELNRKYPHGFTPLPVEWLSVTHKKKNYILQNI